MADQRSAGVEPDALHRKVLQAYEALGYPHSVVGSWAISDNDVADFVEIVAERQPRKILEVGTFVGVSTLLMALACPDAEIFTVDPDLPLFVEMGAMQSNLGIADAAITTHALARQAAERLGVADRIHFVRGGFAVTDTFDSTIRHDGAATQLVGPNLCESRGPFDLVFVDGLHTTTAVAADLELAAKAMTPDGTMVLHDCVGFWGANVRAGAFEFLRGHRQYRFTYPRFAHLYKSVGVIRAKHLPRLTCEPIRSSLADAGAGASASDLMARATQAVAPGPTLELAVQAPLLPSTRKSKRKLFYRLGLPIGSAERATKAVASQVRAGRIKSLFSADILDFAPDETLSALMAEAKSSNLPLICAFTPPGEAGVAGPESRPLASLIDLAAANDMFVHLLPALREEPVRYEMLPDARELGQSSLFSCTLLFSKQPDFTDATGSTYVRLTPEAGSEREQLALQRVHLACAFRSYFQQSRTSAELVARLETRKAEVEAKALADQHETAETVARLIEEAADAEGRYKAAARDIESYVSEKLSLETATLRLVSEAEALRCGHEVLRDAHEALSTSHQELLRDHATLRDAHEALTAGNQELLHVHATLRDSHAILTADHQELSHEHAALRAAHDTVAADLASTRAELAAARETEAAQRGALTALTCERAKLSTQLAAARMEVESAQRSLSEQRAAAEALFFPLLEAYRALDNVTMLVHDGLDSDVSESADAMTDPEAFTKSVNEVLAGISALITENARLQCMVTALQGSTSWRVTAPLRAASTGLRTLKSRIRGLNDHHDQNAVQ